MGIIFTLSDTHEKCKQTFFIVAAQQPSYWPPFTMSSGKIQSEVWKHFL